MRLGLYFYSSTHLHHLVKKGWSDETAGFLKKLKTDPAQCAKFLASYDRFGDTPLWIALADRSLSRGLEKALLLLEAGAEPYTHTKDGRSLLHYLIETREIYLIRLLLWFNPDFERVTGSISPLTALDFLRQVFVYAPTIIELVQKTAADSRRVQELIEKARLARELAHYEKAAEFYHEISSIYENHHEIEKDFRPSCFETDYNYDHDDLLIFYQTRADKARQQAYQSLYLALERYELLVSSDYSHLAAQAKCLEKLADLARELKWSDKAIQHSSACAKLIDELARSEQAEETNINPLIEERGPLLFSGLKHRRSAVEERALKNVEPRSPTIPILGDKF